MLYNKEIEQKNFSEENFLPFDIFNVLLTNCICDTGDDTDTVGFTAKHENYHIDFHIENSDFHVGDFGIERYSEWFQMLPTDLQMDRMLAKCEQKRRELEEEAEQNAKKDDYEEPYYPKYNHT